jgi:hypothetical protein
MVQPTNEGFCAFAVLFGLVFFMAQFLRTGLGHGPFGTGLRLLPGWGTLVLIAPFAGGTSNSGVPPQSSATGALDATPAH